MSLIALTMFVYAVLPLIGHAKQEGQNLPINDYKIGAKDVLEIKVFELPELSQTVRVAEDGSVSLSLLGKVQVAGLTAQELEKELASILDQKYTQAAHVTVFIKEYQRVAVLGAIGRPGMYELVGPTTILQIISQAGGLTPQAMNELYVFRKGKGGITNKITINLDDLFSDGNQSYNIELQPKDEIVIPIDQVFSVYVYGEVKTPGEIQFKQSKKITLMQAIAQAGGLTDWASKSRVVIKRTDKRTGKELKIPVNLKSIISGKMLDLVLAEGDLVIVQ